MKIGNYTLTKDQFSGKENIEGSLDLGSLTSIPEGFNPTVEGSLDLGSLTSIPEGFNPTVGGYLDLGSNTKRIRSEVKPISINRNFFWNKNGKIYAKIDGVFCEILNEKKKDDYTIYSAKKVNRDDNFFIAKKGDFYAHGDTVKKAIEDVEFKVISEKLKNEPIKKDTILTIQYYRLLTGACEMGVKDWMDKNKVKEGIRADELLPLLEKTQAYGLSKFKQLVSWTV